MKTLRTVWILKKMVKMIFYIYNKKTLLYCYYLSTNINRRICKKNKNKQINKNKRKYISYFLWLQTYMHR